MPCKHDLPCWLPEPSDSDPHYCRLCATGSYADCTTYYASEDVLASGHGTRIWPVRTDPKHGAEAPSVGAVTNAIQAASSFLSNTFDVEVLYVPARGHFVLRNYRGHFGLEIFPARLTVPGPLAEAMSRAADQALMWYFDPELWLPEVEVKRHISLDEIKERIEGYQEFIDKEELRLVHQYKTLPPLRELPAEQQSLLVHHWESLWMGFLDLHPAYNWTPQRGFWRMDETIFDFPHS